MSKLKQSLAGLLVLSLLPLAGCGQTEEEAPVDNTPQSTAVETQTVALGEIYNENELSGQIVASREVQVGAPLAAKVIGVSVKVGDTVGVNQTLFTMDKSDIQKQYQPLLDNYNRTKTLSDETIRQAQKNVEDTEALLALGAASQAQLDQAKLALLQQQTTAESSLSQLEESLKDVNKALEDATVKAPIAGVVTAVNVVENATASPQGVAVSIAENQKPQVKVAVSESLIPALDVGDPVEITVPAVSANSFTAKIRSISPNVDAQTQLYDVKMDVPTGEGYQVGMFANAVFRMNRRTDTVVIPSEAILTDGVENYVFIVTSEGTAARVVVKTGIASGEQTEVTEGLAGGEQLVTKGQSYLKDGSLVRVTNPPAEEAEG